MVCLRSATTADDHAMAAVHREAIRGIGSGEDRVDEYTADELDAWASAQDSERYPFEDESQYLAVAEREEAECDPRRSEADADSRVVGFVGVDLGAGVLETLYVRPEAAGEGVGTTLLDHAERVAREDGHDELLTGASLNAVGFYERHGYDRWGYVIEREL